MPDLRGKLQCQFSPGLPIIRKYNMSLKKDIKFPMIDCQAEYFCHDLNSEPGGGTRLKFG